MSFSISGDDSTAANAAISALNDALSAYAAQPGPGAKDAYEGATLFPIVTSAAPLALSLGRALYADKIAAAKAALEPFVRNTTERDAITYILSVPAQLFGWIGGLAQGAATPCGAVNNARLVISILNSALAAAE
jgi:hypothetical protein